MGSRLELQTELESFTKPAYFQPPSNVKMPHPCIVYSKRSKLPLRADNIVYKNTTAYQVTIVEKDPDSTIGDRIVEHFQYASIESTFIIDNLYHTIINLYF